MEHLLREGLAALGLDPEAAPALARYGALLLEKNRVMNLTAITDPADVAALHFLDSAAELAEAQTAIRTLGGAVERTEDYAIPGTDVRHRVILIRKIQKTEKKYPRTFAKIKKNPL